MAAHLNIYTCIWLNYNSEKSEDSRDNSPQPDLTIQFCFTRIFDLDDLFCLLDIFCDKGISFQDSERCGLCFIVVLSLIDFLRLLDASLDICTSLFIAFFSVFSPGLIGSTLL